MLWFSQTGTLGRENRCRRIQQQQLWANATQNQECFPTAGHQFKDIRGITGTSHVLETSVNAKFLLWKRKRFSLPLSSSLNKKANAKEMFYKYLARSFNTKMIFKISLGFCLGRKINTNIPIFLHFIFCFNILLAS